MPEVKGIPVAPGLACGRVHIVRSRPDSVPLWTVPGEAVQGEVDRLSAAIVAVREQLELVVDHGKASGRVAGIAALFHGPSGTGKTLAAEAIVQGDKTVPAISAASIVAKVERDSELVALAEQYPEYGFESHKGYPTAKHRRVLRSIGPCPAHRRSYAPVQKALAWQSREDWE